MATSTLIREAKTGHTRTPPTRIPGHLVSAFLLRCRRRSHRKGCDGRKSPTQSASSCQPCTQGTVRHQLDAFLCPHTRQGLCDPHSSPSPASRGHSSTGRTGMRTGIGTEPQGHNSSTPASGAHILQEKMETRPPYPYTEAGRSGQLPAPHPTLWPSTCRGPGWLWGCLRRVCLMSWQHSSLCSSRCVRHTCSALCASDTW